MGEKVEFQGTVVETADRAPQNTDAVIVNGQGLVFRTEENRFGTLGADGFYHGFVPSTQVRDILMGAGDAVEEDDTSAMDLALDKAAEQDAPLVAGSEAPFPTGDVDNTTDPTPGLVTVPDSDTNEVTGKATPGGGNVGGTKAGTTDHNPTLAPATKEELDDLSTKGSKKS